jgi:protease-4
MGNAGINQLEAIGAALKDFRKRGKKVIAAEDFFTQKKYFLASYADTIILNPMGAVELHGFGVYRLYFKDFLDKLHIKVHVFRVGQYKSAVEPFMDNAMSADAKEQNGKWLDALWNNFTATICRNRSLKPDAVDNYINNVVQNLSAAGGDTGLLAKKYGLVDKLMTREELRDYLAKLTGPAPGTDFRQVSYKDYLKTISPSYEGGKDSENQIGIIVAEGTILNGNQPIGAIGGDSLARLIHNAQTNDKIKAVVLRVNSGGGSVFASEIIRQALLSLKKNGKPYVVSMGSVAASGAYWISADANEIFATPTTITGSIGIFGAIPTFDEALDKLGVHSDGTGTTSLAAGMDLTRPFSPILAKVMKLSIDRGYQKFETIVEKGRKLTPAALEAIGGGRVFDGKKAQEIGLVDKMGTLKDAIAAAAKIAGLKNYTAHYLHNPLSIKSKILQRFGVQIMSLLKPLQISSGLLSEISWITAPIDKAAKLNDPHGIYSLLTFAYR